jgi:hypothetical protein
MDDFLNGDTINIYSEYKSFKGFFISIQKWAYVETIQIVDLKGKKYKIDKDRDDVKYVEYDKDYFHKANTCRMILIEKQINFTRLI